MTTRTNQMTEPAEEAYKRNLATAAALAERIFSHLSDLAIGNDLPAYIHWGHVGDQAATATALRAISDRMFGEGEHAPEAE